MDQVLIHIEWNAANIFRLSGIFITAMLLLEMAVMMSHYWWRMMPLRRELGEHVVAPPVGWTFCYHLGVFAFIVCTSIATGQRMVTAADPTLATWTTPPLGLFLYVVVRKFMRFYSEDLNRAERRHLR